MSKRNQQKLNSQTVPFFTRFIHAQLCEELCEEETAAVSGGSKTKNPYGEEYEPKAYLEKLFGDDSEKYSTPRMKLGRLSLDK